MAIDSPQADPPRSAPQERAFDPDALRARYRAERDKRLRADGNEQYVEVTGRFAHFVEDPYVEPGFSRPALHDEVDVVVIGLGPGGEHAAIKLARAGLDVVAVENRLVGGECPYYGCVPSKMMIAAAHQVA